MCANTGDMIYERCASSQVVFCMDRALECASACHKFKILKAECLALLGRYPEAQSVARYGFIKKIFMYSI